MTPTNGKPPKEQGPFMVEFRSGCISGPFMREQLRWTDEGSSWCVVAAEPTQSTDQSTTWNAKSGGY